MQGLAGYAHPHLLVSRPLYVTLVEGSGQKKKKKTLALTSCISLRYFVMQDAWSAHGMTRQWA